MTAIFLRYISNTAICVTFALILFLITLSYKTNELEVVSWELRLFAVYCFGGRGTGGWSCYLFKYIYIQSTHAPLIEMMPCYILGLGLSVFHLFNWPITKLMILRCFMEEPPPFI